LYAKIHSVQNQEECIVRGYRLNPTSIIKDYRTNYVGKEAKEVLDGAIDLFLNQGGVEHA
jgi:protein subunit release factor B